MTEGEPSTQPAGGSLFERMSRIAHANEQRRAAGIMPIQLFHEIEDGIAIVRKPRGVHVQTKIYQRNGRVYIGAGGGFIRITARFGEEYGTSHPDYKVLEIEGTGVELPRPNANGEPKYEG